MTMDSHEFEMLTNFFGGYFHQDWACDSTDPSEVVATYLETANAEEAVVLSRAIIEYAKSFDSDAELEKKLFSELGCYYRPTADGQSARGWLREIASQLRPRKDT